MSNQVLVRLKKAHTHAGVQSVPGAEIQVGQADADWLVANGVGELVNISKDAGGKEAKK
ncbi:MAG: hypothetical protein WA071_05845 [Undibacterium umbellatum]